MDLSVYARGSEVQISHKTSKKYLKNIQKSITELLHLAAATMRRIIVPHVTYKVLDLFGLSKFKGGQSPLAPLIKISLINGGVYSQWLTVVSVVEQRREWEPHFIGGVDGGSLLRMGS